MARQSPDDLPEKLPRAGNMGSCGLDHGRLLEHPLRMGEDHSKVSWLQTFGGTGAKGRGTMSVPIDAGR